MWTVNWVVSSMLWQLQAAARARVIAEEEPAAEIAVATRATPIDSLAGTYVGECRFGAHSPSTGSANANQTNAVAAAPIRPLNMKAAP